MARPQQSNVTVQGNIGGDKIAMSIDQDAIAHIMGVLTDLYSDPELAVLREYSTNALDAHVEAGSKAPIEVDLPTPLAPFLTIRDFGVGLSHDDIRNIYSRYGVSTKRETDEQTGSLGLGCKSALTYASQFTLVGVKDGRRCQVTISRDEDGAGSMTVVEDHDTTEPNGVEVKVPAKTANTFERKAKDFFRFWPEGTVLVNGEAPEPLDGLKISDKLYVRNGGSQSVVVMGNIPYPTTFDAHETGLNYSHSLVAFVDIGEVVHTPSREALQDVPLTLKTKKRLVEGLHTNAREAVQRDLDNCKSHHEALVTLRDWRQAFPRHIRPGDYRYRGVEIPSQIVHPSSAGQFVTTRRSSYTLGSSSNSRAVPADGMSDVIWVEGWDLNKFTASHKRKLNQYCENGNISGDTYVLTDTMPDRTWLDSATVIQWDKVNEIKLPRNGPLPGGSGRPQGSYDAFVDGTFGLTLAADIDTNHPVLWLHGNRNRGGVYRELLDESFKKYTLVCLSENRIAKFKRDFPNAVRVKDQVQNLYDAWAKNLTEDDKLALAMNDTYGAQDSLRAINPAKVNDPWLAKCAKIAKRDVGKMADIHSNFRRYGATTQGTTKFKNPLDSYPFVSRSYTISAHPRHTYLYLNAVYAADCLTKKS